MTYGLDASALELCEACSDDGHSGRLVAVFAATPGMGGEIRGIGFDEQTLVGYALVKVTGPAKEM